MVKKVIPLLVEKYDIANKILRELVDLESRHILFSIIKKTKNCPRNFSRVKNSNKFSVQKNSKSLEYVIDIRRKKFF